MKVYTLVVLFIIILQSHLLAQNQFPVYHIVKRGETLRGIASKYKTTPREILQLNRPLTSNKLKPNTKLLVRYVSRKQLKQNIRKYQLQKGDTPSLVARKFGISETLLRQLMKEQNLAFKETKKIPDSIIKNGTTVNSTPKTPVNTTTTVTTDIQRFSSDIETNIPSTTKQNNNAIAVIIGNKNYLNQDVPEVSYAHRDANTFKNYLINSLGYKEGNIIYAEDATQATFFSIFGNEANHKGKLYNYVKPNESDVFIYYNGHGGPSPETKEAYFVPSDCDPSQLSLNGYALNTFYNNLAQLPYKTITVVIDACFSGVSEGGALLKNMSPIFINTENKIKLDENAIVLTASANNQVASWYPEKQHSLFSYFLMKGMQGEADQNNDQKIALKELGTYLLEEVPYWARRLHSREQSPEIWGNPIHTFSTY